MRIASDYLDRLGLPHNASDEQLLSLLAAQADRCQVLLKIPLKRAQAVAQLELIATVQGLITASVPEPEIDPMSNLMVDPDMPNLWDMNPPAARTSAPKANPSTKTDTPPMPKVAKIPTAPPLSPEKSRSVNQLGPILDQGEWGKIRRTITEWANTIPHHEYTAFGNDIEIISVEQQAIYYLRCAALAESRSLKELVNPYLGESLPFGVAITAEKVALWEIKLPEQPHFEVGQSEHEIAASRHRIDCPTCEKQGEMWCRTCQSSGLISCVQCGGRYQLNCANCAGTGVVLTKDNKRIECSNCRGTRITICGACREGLAQCGTCRGYRRITCQTCQGRKEMLQSLAVQVQYQPYKAATTLRPDPLPEYIYKRLDNQLYERNATALLQHTGGSQVEKQPIKSLEIKSLQEKLFELLERTLAQAQTATAHLHKYLIEVRACPTIQVAYRYEDKAYELWLIGEQRDVYARSSPPQEYDQKLANLAAKALLNNELNPCLELLARAFLHTPNSATSLIVTNNCVAKVDKLLAEQQFAAVINIAEQAENLLGNNLAVNFRQLSNSAASAMRREYILASIASGLVAIALGYLTLTIISAIYAQNVMLGVSVLLILLITGLSWLFAPQIGTRKMRLILATSTSLIIVIVSSIIGLIFQEDYIGTRKREAISRFGSGDYQSAKTAIEPLESALWAAPRDFELQLLLGRAYARATYYEKALGALKIALELNSNSAEAHNELGFALLGKGETAAALEHFYRAIALKAPQIYPEAYQNLGRALGLVYLEGGEFMMGEGDSSAINGPPHHMVIKPFFIDKYEVTNAQYLKFVQSTNHPAPASWRGSEPLSGTENQPVLGIALADARAYTEWRSKKEAKIYRLPTEEEWEFAARGSRSRRFPWGNEWQPGFANVRGGEGQPSPVGSFAKGSTPEGVADMLGNAAEWIDTPLKSYPGGKVSTLEGYWVVRGGAYDNLPQQVSAANRSSALATGGDYHNIGFRCVLDTKGLTK